MSQNPLVSVVIPAFNSSKTIARAIGSALQQDYCPLEIIIVDDGSTDETAKIVETFSSSHVQLIRLPFTHGASGARNAGVSYARGKYVAFLDADDAWHPTKTSLQVRMLEADDGIILHTCDCVCFSESGTIWYRSHERHPPMPGNEAWKTLLEYMFIPTSTALVRREDFLTHGGFDPKLVVGEDLDLWIRLSVKGKVEIVPQVLVSKYQQRDSLMNSCGDGEARFVLPMIEGYLEKYKDRLSSMEIRYIRGRRYVEIGRNLYYDGLYRLSVPLFWQSFLLGHHPMQSLIDLAKAAMMSLVKWQLRARIGRA